jgi:REP element-mobilizing transposase RayT
MARIGNRKRNGASLQLGLDLRKRTWGGARPGAGRKPRAVRPTPHRARPALASRFPVHVTLKLDESLPDLRDEELSGQVEQCLGQGKAARRFRLVHYCILTHHLHLIVEAADADALTQGIRGLSVRLARCINRFSRRKGRVFVDRYFARTLKTPREVRHGLSYVLLNCRRHAAQHGRKLRADWLDPCSSGRFFDGWRHRPSSASSNEVPTVAPAGTWLLRQGWRRHGLLRIDEVPGAARAPTTTGATRAAAARGPRCRARPG